jgi:hypothetical protein
MGNTTGTGAENTGDLNDLAEKHAEFTRTVCDTDPRFEVICIRLPRHPDLDLPNIRLVGRAARLRIAKYYFASMFGVLTQLQMVDLATILFVLATQIGLVKEGGSFSDDSHGL